MNENLVLPLSIESELESRVSADIREAYFPERGIVTKLAATSLFASIETEEKRQVRFSIAYTRPELGDGKPSWNAICFESPRPLTVNEIVKLAPALDPSLSSIGVSGGLNTLKIWGILNHGASMKRMLLDERGGASNYPYWAVPFIVQALVPGTLSYWLGNYQILTVARGIIHTPYAYLFGRVGRVANILDKWAQLIPGETSHVRNQFERALRRMVRKLKVLGHGGTIIISPNPEQQDLKVGRHGWINNDIVNKRLTSRIEEIESEIRPIRESGVIPTFSGEIPQRITDKSDLLHDGIDAMVMLSQIDGALILSNELKIITFGAIITAEQSKKFDTYICLDPEGEKREFYDLSTRGTRHQSAAYYCATHPQALAFVQSDDGTLSLFTGSEEGCVLCWKNVEPDYVFTISHLEHLVASGSYLLPKDLYKNGKPLGPSLYQL